MLSIYLLPMRTFGRPQWTHLIRRLLNLVSALAAGRTPAADGSAAAHLRQGVTVGVLVQIGAGIGCRG